MSGKRITIKMNELVGNFAENKDVAKEIRIKTILPALTSEKEVVIDFAGVDGATQSFIHALISEPIRKFGDVAYSNLIYSNANSNIRGIVTVVYRYMQESLDD